MNRRDREKYYKLLLKGRDSLTGQVRRIEASLNKSRKDSAGDLSGYSHHIADAGTDTSSEEVETNIVSSQTDTLREIDDALARLDEGRYGLCELCNELIDPKRLTAIPHARLCIKCQAQSERDG